MQPRFFASGEATPLLVAPARDTEQEGCTTVGVLGTRTMDFALEITGQPHTVAKQPIPGAQRGGRQSTAGGAMLVRCGSSRAELRDLVVRMKSPQGAIEVLVAHGSTPAPSFESLLPERAAGTTLRTGRPGIPPGVAPLPQRLEIATRLVRESGGKVAGQPSLRVGEQGAVKHRLGLDRGCHRLLAAPKLRAPGQRHPADTDMEVRHPLSGDVLVRDRGFATDAVVDLCVGEPVVVDVVIGGVPRGGSVTLLQGQWPLPPGIPETWEPRARASVAHALLHRRSPSLTEPPEWEGVGVGGSTVIPMPIEPGACYLVAVGAATGQARGVQISAQVGARLAADNGGGGMPAAVLTFCAQQEQVARLEVSAFGPSVTWIAGAWKLVRTPMGAEVLP